MPERGQLTGPEAARRRRAWLDSRHRWHRDLVLILLCYAPETEVARALDQLPAGELSHLARLLTQATDLHQVACVYGVPPICAPFAWHLFLLRLAHRRHQDTGQHDQDASQHPQDAGQDPRAPTGRPEQPATMAATNARAASNGQDGEPSRTLVQVLLAGETQDQPVSWQDVAQQTGLSRSRAYALLREERARLAPSNGHQPPLDPVPKAP